MKLPEDHTGVTAAPDSPDALAPVKSTRALWLLSLAIAALGIFLRVIPWAGFQGVGFDEALYRNYVVQLDAVGITSYPEICEAFLKDQRPAESITKLPPTRFLYIYSAWLWKRAEFGDQPALMPGSPNFAQRDPALLSLHRVSSFFTCLWFLVGGIAAWRMFGLRALPAVLALMACAPTQIHFGQHALIDGVMAFWATICVWLLWENLRQPNRTGWLASYAACLACMVLTKENAFFVFVALCGLIAVNRWAKFGTVTPRLLVVSVLGPLAGVLLLVSLAGSVGTFVEIYTLLVSKAQGLTYAIKTGDGPWYRYFVDLMIVEPLVLILAIGGAFTLLRENRAYGYLLAFAAFSYVVMCNVRFGMNLRYASIWELPMCALAAGQVARLAQRFAPRQGFALVLALLALCAYDLRQYDIFFVDAKLYELVTGGLLHAVKILK